jgi:hypothetical protein
MAIIEHVPQVLSATPITREQLADAVTERTGNPHLREVLLSGWGALLKPSARRGDICFGPNQGQNVTFVRPAQWLDNLFKAPSGPLPSLEREPIQALQAVLRNFLTTYGPATLDEFARWWGIDAAQARKRFKAIADELTTVDVDGWQAQLLTTTLAALTRSEPGQTVRLLPYFDPYTIAIARHSDYLLSAAQKNKVYRAQGWIAPVVLVDSRIVGVWEHILKRGFTEVIVTLFEAVVPTVRDGIAAETEELGQFLDSKVKLKIEG